MEVPSDVLDTFATKEDDTITLAQRRAHTACEAITRKYPRFRPCLRGVKPHRVKVNNQNMGSPTFPPATPQAEVRCSHVRSLGDVA